MFTLAEAQAAIANKPEFKCNQREFGYNIDYNLTMPSTFIGETARQTLILKNLRGTCFNDAGEITSLGFDKFHNLNECAGWMDSDINWNQPHCIMTKLDGSMLRPLIVGEKLRLITRAGITEVAVKAEKFIEQLPESQRVNFEDMCRSLIGQGYTPIFEFCSRDQRIVIDYPEAMMPLTAMRCNVGGTYVTRTLLEATGTASMWPVVDVLDSTEFTTIKELAHAVKDWKDAEGVVVAFPDGFRVKIKAAEYVLQHRALDGLRFEKDVVNLILTGAIDDVLPLLPEKRRDTVIAFQASVLQHVAAAEQQIATAYAELVSRSTSRAEFALLVKHEKPELSSYLFSLYAKKPSGLRENIVKYAGSSTKLELLRWAIGPSFYDF